LARKVFDLLLSGYHKLRRPKQRALDFRIREGAESISRRLCVSCGTIARRFEGPIALQDFHNVTMRHTVESPVVQHTFDLCSFFIRATFQCMDHRHCDLTFSQVACHRLAQHVFGGGQIEYIDLQGPHDFGRIKENTIVNCTGYGARALMRDESIIPVRGQLGHIVPQHEISYALRYQNASLVPRHDELVVQRVTSDMDGYDNPSVIPDRAESEEVIQKFASIFARMTAPG